VLLYNITSQAGKENKLGESMWISKIWKVVLRNSGLRRELQGVCPVEAVPPYNINKCSLLCYRLCRKTLQKTADDELYVVDTVGDDKSASRINFFRGRIPLVPF